MPAAGPALAAPCGFLDAPLRRPYRCESGRVRWHPPPVVATHLPLDPGPLPPSGRHRGETSRGSRYIRSSVESRVNDFSIQVATVNGSGSQTANAVLLRALFQMGIPVSGKNLFPSNIAGLPTWFTIRASKDGYIARRTEIDFLVAMNAETAQDDVVSLAPGAAVLYDEPLKLNALRNDLTFYTVPYDK